MQIQVSGHQLAAGEAFRDYATDALDAVKDKYFKRALSATVTLHPGPHGAGFACEAVMHVRGNVILKGSGGGPRANGAFDVALAKIDKQLRRHVRRLHDHDGMNGEERVAMDAGYTVFAVAEAEIEEQPDIAAPLVIAEAAVDVPRASVADAVLMLDCATSPRSCSSTAARARTTWSTAAKTETSVGSNPVRALRLPRLMAWMSDRVQAHPPLPRLATSVWVAALLRRTHARGAFGTIVRKGDAEGGAVILLQRARDGGTTAWARVAQGGASIWAIAAQSPPHNTTSVDDYLARQECYDPDLWIVELVIDEIQLLVAEPSQIR